MGHTDTLIGRSDMQDCYITPSSGTKSLDQPPPSRFFVCTEHFVFIEHFIRMAMHQGDKETIISTSQKRLGYL